MTTGTTELQQARPSPEEYGDYRTYLGDMVVFLKATRRGFSYRSFAKSAGFSSTGFLKHVIDGERNISQRSIVKFARALGLTKSERDIFEVLVNFSQATTDEDRNHYYEKLRRRRRGTATALTQAQYDAYSLWYAMPIREMMLLPDFEEDPDWIAARLFPHVRASEVRKALGVLERTGLIQRDDTGRLRPVDVKILAIREIERLAVRNYHRSMLHLALESLDGLPRSQRNMTSLTVTINDEQYEDVCARIAAFEQELLGSLDDAPRGQEKRDVHVLAFQLFPVTMKRRN